MKAPIDRRAYELDRFEMDGRRFPALTEKNAVFIEAVVRLDSRYSKDVVFNEDGDNNEGTIPYWFNKIKNEEGDYGDNVAGVMRAINGSNTTRASLIDVRTIAERVVNRFQTKDDLINALNTAFCPNNDNHILSVMVKKEGNRRFELSLASKFCAYASIWLRTNFQYAKYDKIVSKNLCFYVKKYLDEDKEEGDFYIDLANRRGTEEELYKERLKKYYSYNLYIEKILEALRKKEIDMTKEVLDHIIWYGLK